jgi:acyl transferase domain-containing protein/acyl carrier protein
VNDEVQQAGEGRDIAVIGMAGRFPRARDLRELWRNLRDGIEAVTFFSDEELLAAGVPAERLRDPRYVKAGSVLAGVEGFDAGFFGYSAHEAAVMDPQQRLFLEHAWAALEDAGYTPEGYEGMIGVYAGVAWNTYLLSNLTTRRDLFDGGGGFQVFITNDKDFMPTRVSYKLNLKGPSLVVQTSCSTSLVAVHLATLSLLSYECDMALAGGVTVRVPQVEGYYALEGGLASPDGHCRAFDARAAGTIFGSGVGVVVLKRLADALADGDSIRAVIKGSAINNDGSLKVSYTAPSVEGQAEVIAQAQALAGVSPESLRYVETHGTGTALGDPIEVTALTRVFRDSTDRRGFCALGSIKTNLGHLDAAAGIAGFLKTVMALEHRQIPPSLHFERPNPAIDFESSPFYVNAALADWAAGETPRRAGVSSFGVGGTNAHVILEEAPPAGPVAASRPWQLLLLSARSEETLAVARDNLLAWLGDADDGSLPDAAYTLRIGRAVFRHRLAAVCRDRAEAIAALAGSAPGRLFAGVDLEDPRDRPVVFLFPEEGMPQEEAPRGLYETEPVFRQELDRCARLLGRTLWPAAGGPFTPADWFAIEYALAQLWISWGVRPQAASGEGIGELVAACVMGELSLADGLAQASSPAPRALQPGRFAAVLSSLLRDRRRLFLEVGPGRALTDLVERHPERSEQAAISSLGDPRDGTPDLAALLAALGRLWLAGLRIDWPGFHAGEHRRRVPLPTYPFERQDYWIAPGIAPAAAGKRPDVADWFYLPAWKPEPRLTPAADGSPPRRWLVLCEPGGPSARLAERLAAHGEVISVEPATLAGAAEGWRRLSENAFAVHLRSSIAWESLLAELKAQGRLPDAVVHAWDLDSGGMPVDEAEAFEAAQERGFYTLLGLARAMATVGWTPARLAVVASGLFALHAGEEPRPERATVLGFCKVLPQEVPGIACLAVDAALPAPGSAAEARLLEEVAAEVATASAERVAFRGAQRWVPAPAPVRLSASALREDGAPRPFRERGVYLLTGGLEGNAFAVACWLARTVRARLALLVEPSSDPAVPAESRLRALEELGAEVLAIPAELGDVAAVRAAVRRAEESFGALHGLIHGAGTQGERTFRLVRELDREACGWHFVPKVHALLALEKALAGHDLEVCLLLSSLATELGGVAYAAYTAANCFLDAFARDRARRGVLPWTSVGWDVWQLEGESDQITAVRDDLASLAMTPREGEEAFQRAAAAGVDWLLVSTADLAARSEQSGRRIGALRERAAATQAPRGMHPRPALPVPYAPPESDLERRIEAVWSRALGFERIGVHDNFFELGGDSFAAVQVVSRLQDELKVELPVAKLYQGLTVRALATLLARDETAASEEHAAHLEERRESMDRRREFLERRRSSRKSEAV